jgi:DNA-binding transcriptional MerR regulator/effector-binding domain-containing protein
VFRIAAFARLSGLSPKVLRDYDAVGVFRPAWVDRATGYRMYTPAQLPELRRIVALRDVGVGLEEIRALVDERADLRSVLQRRLAALEAARAELDRRLASLGISIATAAVDVVVRSVPGELVATLDVATTDGDVGRAFYVLEARIRDAGVRAPRPPGGLIGGDGLGPEVEIFVPVRRPAADLETRRLPPIRAATALHHGSYESIGRTRRALDAWIEAAGLRRGSPDRIVYLQFGAESELRVPAPFVVDRSADLLTELQVPIG